MTLVICLKKMKIKRRKDIIKMVIGKWLERSVRDLTLEDAIEAYTDGVCFICGDGKLRHIVRETNTKDILDVLNGRKAVLINE